jgi:phage repressor protein C with HTH and peptisase S24 domain
LFSFLSNATFNNKVFRPVTIAGMPSAHKVMHESATRLYEAAQKLRGVTKPAEVARLLNISQQNLTGWEKRGVSSEGAIAAQSIFGVSATWLVNGTGPMSIDLSTDELYRVSSAKQRPIWVIGKGQGGLPERIWTDGDFPVGASNEFAEVASADQHAFLVPVVGDSMAPRYLPGEYALVEPGTEPDLEDDVLVRLVTGETMLKRLLSRRAGHLRFGSWNDPVVHTYPQEQVVWYYYVAHGVPARKIKSRF